MSLVLLSLKPSLAIFPISELYTYLPFVSRAAAITLISNYELYCNPKYLKLSTVLIISPLCENYLYFKLTLRLSTKYKHFVLLVDTTRPLLSQKVPTIYNKLSKPSTDLLIRTISSAKRSRCSCMPANFILYLNLASK